jgi:protein subunit release factor B
MTNKTPILTLTRKDFEMQFLRAGGKGGQNVNKVSSAVRITHPASGAVGEARDLRDQHKNRRLAFQRLVASRTFQAWLKLEVASRLQGYRNAEQKVDQMMREENLDITYYDPGTR